MQERTMAGYGYLPLVNSCDTVKPDSVTPSVSLDTLQTTKITAVSPTEHLSPTMPWMTR